MGTSERNGLAFSFEDALAFPVMEMSLVQLSNTPEVNGRFES